MRRLVISISILLLIVSFSLTPTFAAEKAAKSLRQAVISGDISQIQLLISQGADVNAKNKGGQTSLYTATVMGQKDVAKLLIDKGADVNAKDNSGQTPLYLAADFGRRDVAELLIAKGSDVNVKDNSGRTPLHRAASAGQKDVAELLIAKGSDVNVKDNSGHTPLYNAAQSGKKDVGDLLIARGAVVSSLHVAAFTGDLDKIRSFITGGADVNAKDNSGLTPIHFVISDKAAEFLIARGADVNAKSMSGKTALHLAASRGHKDVAELLIDRGADVNAEDNYKIKPNGGMSSSSRSGGGAGQAPLHWAVYSGHADMVELLIAKGADINAAPEDGMSALEIATDRKHVELVELLEKHGATGPQTWTAAETVARTEDRISRLQAGPERPQRRASTYAKSAAQPYPIDDEDEDEEEYVPVRPRQRKPAESIHQAVVDGDIDQVQQLLSQGADINSRNRMGWSLLRTAIQNRRQAVVELLIAKGANVSAKDNSGQTPLLVAVNTGQKDTVELLITKGADVNIMGSRGDNALSLAKKRRHTEIVELLLEHGAEEPSLEDMMGDRYDEEGLYPGYEDERMAQRPTRTISPIVQQPVVIDILADPNEIKARIKTFEGLEKALAEVAEKSQSEMRQWQQKRYDNKTLLIRTVQKQFEDEIGFVRKAAVEEKATKTTEAIDSLLSRRKERLKMVSRELLEQKRAEKQAQAPTRGRTRYSGRSTRSRYPQRGQLPGGDMSEQYAERYDTMPGTSRYQGARRPSELVDRETENEIRLWTQSTIDKRAELAKGVHEQIRIEISPIRKLADEEEAKKATAAIDGLLLYRQLRFEELVKKMEEEQRTLQQTQDPRGGRYGEQTGRYPQSGRYRGRTSTRGGTAGQDQYGQQGQQTRRRRR